MARALCFVKGHPRPSAVDNDKAGYVRRHPDGSPMYAEGLDDTLDACQERWEQAQKKTTAKKAPAKRATRKAKTS